MDQDAEDAFQATFLILVRKAASVKPRSMVGNWLYGVARQTSLNLRTALDRRRAREIQVANMPEKAAHDPCLCGDFERILDEELGRLADKYRAILVLCDLEGKTRRDASRHLGLPEGTVGSRLARARMMLAKRLTKRGVALSAAALAAMLVQNVASAGVTDAVLSRAIRAASLFAAGQTTAAGAASAKVAALAEGVLKTMMISKLKAAAAVVLVLGLMVSGVGVLKGRMASAQSGHTPVQAVPQSRQGPNVAAGQASRPARRFYGPRHTSP